MSFGIFQFQQNVVPTLSDLTTVHNVFLDPTAAGPTRQRAVAVAAGAAGVLSVRHENGAIVLVPVGVGIPIPVGASWDSIRSTGTTATGVCLFF